MNNDKKYVEIKDNSITDENLIEFFNNEFKGSKFNNPEINKFEKFMREELGYSISYGKITNKEGNNVTIQEFLDDLQKRVESDSEFAIEISVCKHLSKYIDFDKTNINVLLPIDINEESQEFLKELHNCNKLVRINKWAIDNAGDLEWLRKEENIKILKMENKEDFEVSEFITRYNMFKQYTSEKKIDNYESFFEYDYFIRNSCKIITLEMLDKIADIEKWMEDNEFEIGPINLKINPSYNEITDDHIKQLLESGKYTVQVDTDVLNLENIERIKRLEELGASTKIEGDESCLKVDTIAQVDNEIIEKLDIKYVEIGSDENKFVEKLTVQKYKIIRSILEDVVKDIDIEQSDREKFKMVYTRLANMLTYDEEAIEDGTDYANENKNKCRNLENGLLYGKCVCAGYAEILKQALSLVGIESHYVTSKEEGKEGQTHAYNIVKIDGEWYNADLTWDHEYIRNNITPKYCLKNDKDFRKTGLDSEEYHMPAYEEMDHKCESDSIEIYQELKKNLLMKKVKFFIDTFKEVGIKTVISNIGKIVKEKFSEKDTLMLAPATSQNPNKSNFFRGSLKEGAPSLREQADLVSLREETKEEIQINNDGLEK